MELREAIVEAKTTFCSVCYPWDLPPIADNLIEAANRGVDVKIVLAQELVTKEDAPLLDHLTNNGVKISLSPIKTLQFQKEER